MPASELAMMVAPTSSSNHTPSPMNGGQSVTILREYAGSFGPHSIPPQHIFHNCDGGQVAELFGTQEPGDILIIVWGLEHRHLTYTTEVKIEATLRAYFANHRISIEIAPPTLPASHRAKGPVPPNAQKFIDDHTGTPFTFYIRGLTVERKAEILQENFLPTSLDSYLVLDASDFVTDFVFTIDGLNAQPDEQGQKIVEKLIKDKLYTSHEVWSFLHSHHDAIGPNYPVDKIPSLVILSLEARGIWIEGRRGEPGRQGWNIWIAHPTKVPRFHLDWLAALKSAFPIRSGNGFGGVARILDVPFFCKGCKGESHPTTQCPLKEQLGNLLKRPRNDDAARGRTKTRGSRGGRSGRYNGRA
ncbi:hypothetical protein ARMSODRAFT_652785 [Armillaria solidipes]|uniref:Uncharacterized protein n=1 Tax=Armillaria solidipes TaxID=1076256 RepID=A0A2H3C3S1_9AGAR|nr:hypothetical protein ARMSODRAFT_365955 [Armillaria solidipes]PBK73882.1 hypothetical protein ARMSODRAFT_652785 [Armillaria solidipes]